MSYWSTRPTQLCSHMLSVRTYVCPSVVLSFPTFKHFENKTNKTGVINDPLGQTHSHASSEHCFLLFCFSRFEKWGWMDVQTYNMCENNDPYRPWLWIGRVDQNCRVNRWIQERLILQIAYFPFSIWTGNLPFIARHKRLPPFLVEA